MQEIERRKIEVALKVLDVKEMLIASSDAERAKGNMTNEPLKAMEYIEALWDCLMFVFLGKHDALLENGHLASKSDASTQNNSIVDISRSSTSFLYSKHLISFINEIYKGLKLCHLF